MAAKLLREQFSRKVLLLRSRLLILSIIFQFVRQLYDDTSNVSMKLAFLACIINLTNPILD